MRSSIDDVRGFIYCFDHSDRSAEPVIWVVDVGQHGIAELMTDLVAGPNDLKTASFAMRELANCITDTDFTMLCVGRIEPVVSLHYLLNIYSNAPDGDYEFVKLDGVKGQMVNVLETAQLARSLCGKRLTTS